MSDWFSLVICLPVSTSTPSGISALDALGELVLADGPVALGDDGIHHAGLADEGLRRRGVEQRERGAGGGVGVTELGHADEGELLAAALGQHGDLVTELELALLEAGPVDQASSLAPGRRPSTIRHADRSPP